MTGALRALGKDVRVVNRDQAPSPLLTFPWVDQIEIADRAEGDFDAVVVMECGDLARTGGDQAIHPHRGRRVKIAKKDEK